MLAAVFFVLGLSTVFLFLGFTASAFGRFFLSNQDWFVTIAGIVIMVFGGQFAAVLLLAFAELANMTVLDEALHIQVEAFPDKMLHQ